MSDESLVALVKALEEAPEGSAARETGGGGWQR
jgi:hypothetical protein